MMLTWWSWNILWFIYSGNRWMLGGGQAWGKNRGEEVGSVWRITPGEAVSEDLSEKDQPSGVIDAQCGRRSSTGWLNWSPCGPHITRGDSSVSPVPKQKDNFELLYSCIHIPSSILSTKYPFLGPTEVKLYCPCKLWNRFLVWCLAESPLSVSWWKRQSPPS